MEQIINKHQDIYKRILKMLRECDSFIINVSYIQWINSFDKILDVIKDKSGKIILSLEGGITDVRVLEELLPLKNIETFVMLTGGDRGLHNKTILTTCNDNNFITIGSSNFSYYAFTKNIEQNVFIDNASPDQVNSFEDNISYILNAHSIRKLDNEVINIYKFIRPSLYNELNLINFENQKIVPNDMQLEALQNLNRIRILYNKALIVSATGTGKTYLSVFDTKQLKSKKILFIVHSRVILQSAIKTFKDVYKNTMTIQEMWTSNAKLALEANIVFTTDKTLSKIIFESDIEIKDFEYVIFDEAHKIGAKHYSKIFNFFNNKKNFILGMTATPERSDDRSKLYRMFDNNIASNITLETAIKKSYISKFNYFAINGFSGEQRDFKIKFEKLKNVLNKFDDINNEQYNTWDGKKVKGLIFASNIDESQMISNYLNSWKNTNMYSQSITSKDNLDIDEIGSLIETLEDNYSNLSWLVTVNKFNEGIDIPSINTVVMFRPTKSSIIYTQELGRGLRKQVNLKTWEEKKLNVIDLVGNDSNAFKVISGWNGYDKSPIRQFEDISNLINNKSLIMDAIYLDPIAMNSIFDSLSKYTYKKYLTSSIDDQVVGNKGKQPSLIEFIEKSTMNSISLIINSLKDSKTFGKNSIPYIWRIIYSKEKIIKLNKSVSYNEKAFIEALSWMPLTISSINDKFDFILFLQGNEVKFNSTWSSYIIGNNNGKENKISFDSAKIINSNNGLFSITTSFLNNYKYEIENILSYLQKKENVNDYLVYGNLYTNVEMWQMMGYLNFPNSGFMKIVNEDSKHFGKYFLRNSMSENNSKNNICNPLMKNSESNPGYVNKIISKSKITESFADLKFLKNNKTFKILNFVGTDKFLNKNQELFMFLGEITEKDIHNVRIGLYKQEDKKDKFKEFNYFDLELDNPLTNEQYELLERYATLVNELKSKMAENLVK